MPASIIVRRPISPLRSVCWQSLLMSTPFEKSVADDTIAEFTLGDAENADHYDVSNVDGERTSCLT